MATEARIGHGTLFAIFDVGISPPDWVTVAEVVSVTPPSLSRDAVDATHTESPEKWREFIPGLRDGGEVTLEMNFIPKGAGISTILGSFNRDEVVNSRITFPDETVPGASPSDATVWTFLAFITGFEPEAPVDDKMVASVTFKLSGKPTFLAA